MQTLPHNLDAEASVLGGVILRNEVLVELDKLETDDFYDMRHKVVWGAIRNLEHGGRPIDVVTLEAEIERAGKLEAIGGVGFLGELTLRVPIVENVLAYAEIVTGHSQVRELALGAEELARRAAAHWDREVDELLGDAMAMLARMDRGAKTEALAIGDVVKRRMAELEQLARAKEAGELALVGVPTGIAALDKRIGGYPLGDLSLIGARPAMGKTALAMSTVDAATKACFGAHVFSQEGGWRMYADRALSKASGIPVERIRTADFHAGDASKLANGMMKLGLRKGWLVDTEAHLSAQAVIRRVRKHMRTNNTRLVVFDYIQLMRRPRNGMTENEAIDENITAFSQAALELDIAFVVLSQLNREVEKREDKRPQKSDLRGSGALEERPRIILSPYRGVKYYDTPRKGVEYDCNCDAPPCPHVPSAEAFEKLVQVLILKNSNGQEGYVEATWHGPTVEMS